MAQEHIDKMQVRILPSPADFHAYDLWVNGQKEIEGETFAVVDAVRGSLQGQTCGAFIEADEIAHSICKNRGLRQGTR